MTGTTETAPPGGDLREAAAAALADVNALELTGDDRNTVLEALLKARLGGFIVPAPKPADEQHADPNGGKKEPPKEGDVIGQIGAALDVDRDVVELVYALQDGEPMVVVSAKKISTNKAAGTRQLGQLVSAARQIAGLEEWTSSATIRKVATDYGRVDASNFASTLKEMDDVALIRGNGQQREIRITKPGLESTADLVKSLAGSGT